VSKEITKGVKRGGRPRGSKNGNPNAILQSIVASLHGVTPKSIPKMIHFVTTVMEGKNVTNKHSIDEVASQIITYMENMTAEKVLKFVELFFKRVVGEPAMTEQNFEEGQYSPGAVLIYKRVSHLPKTSTHLRFATILANIRIAQLMDLGQSGFVEEQDKKDEFIKDWMGIHAASGKPFRDQRVRMSYPDLFDGADPSQPGSSSKAETHENKWKVF